MASHAYDVSIVICAYASERWDAICRAVDSVTRQTRPPQEIFVVVDHNTPLFARARRELEAATVIENQGPRGLSAARNTGLACAGGDIVAFLDDDAVASPSWLEQLLKWYRSWPVVGVGGSIVPLWEAGRPRRFPREFDWVVGCTYAGLPVTAGPVRNLIGANMSFRRSALISIGGFRGSFGRIGSYPAGCEETDACIRLTRAAPTRRLVYDPHAVVHHHVPRERTDVRYFSARCYAEGLSKARLAMELGSTGALASERAYVRRILPRAFAGGIRDLLRGDESGAGRAGMVALGFGMTAAGYAAGRVSFAFPGRNARGGPVDAARRLGST